MKLEFINRDIAHKAIDIIKSYGAQQARVSLNYGSQSSFGFLDNSLDKLMNSNDQSLFLQIFIDDRYGAFSIKWVYIKGFPF